MWSGFKEPVTTDWRSKEHFEFVRAVADQVNDNEGSLTQN